MIGALVDGRPVRLGYAVRFIAAADAQELVRYYHLARVALDNPTRWQRLQWAAREFHKMHPDVSSTGAYKDLEGLLA